MKYLTIYNGEGDFTAEEHSVAFYSFADKFNIDYSDVWMRLFIQSLDGELRKWFRGRPPASIVDIDVLDEAFINKWGDRREIMVSLFHTSLRDSKRCMVESHMR
jgi:hypothetical protein